MTGPSDGRMALDQQSDHWKVPVLGRMHQRRPPLLVPPVDRPLGEPWQQQRYHLPVPIASLQTRTQKRKIMIGVRISELIEPTSNENEQQ